MGREDEPLLYILDEISRESLFILKLFIYFTWNMMTCGDK